MGRCALKELYIYLFIWTGKRLMEIRKAVWPLSLVRWATLHRKPGSWGLSGIRTPPFSLAHFSPAVCGRTTFKEVVFREVLGKDPAQPAESATSRTDWENLVVSNSNGTPRTFVGTCRTSPSPAKAMWEEGDNFAADGAHYFKSVPGLSIGGAVGTCRHFYLLLAAKFCPIKIIHTLKRPPG